MIQLNHQVERASLAPNGCSKRRANLADSGRDPAAMD
jgi:hypothetical protein